jgi:S-adenosylmethionine synthetase
VAGRLFTSESVTEGHPDKIADRISDSVLDHLMAEDPDRANLRVAVETLLTTGLVVVAGEVRTGAYAPVADIVRKAILDIGYDSSDKGFDGHTCGVQVAIGAQSSDIAAGVDAGHESRVGSSEDELDKRGAGDQGLMFGYACDDTPELMPLPITIAQRLAQRLTRVRKDGTLAYLRPDGKTQVTIEYDEDDRPVRVDTVVLSTQHGPDIEHAQLEADIKQHVIDPVLADFDIPSEGYRMLVNPTGTFVIGGPMGDAGLTGRKIIIAAARRRSPTPSARHTRSGCSSSASAPRPSRSRRSRRPCSRSSTCGRRRSSATSTCSARSTRRPPPTGTSVASCRTSPGSRPSAPSSSARPPASSPAVGGVA